MLGKAAGALCALGLVGVVAAGAGPAAAATGDRVPAIGPSTNAVDACAASFAVDAFAKAASEADVAAAQPVAVDVTWRRAWYSGEKLDVLGCVAANGRFVDGVVERGIDNRSGLWVHKFSVPANAAEGVVVCEAAVVSGATGDGSTQATRMEPDCFTVTAATAAEAVPAQDAATPKASAGKETTVASGTQPVAPAPSRTAAAVDGPVAAGADPKAGPTTAAAKPAASAASAAPRPATGAAATVPTTQLPHTGAAQRRLVAGGGALLALGGWALTFGATTRRPSARTR